MRSAKPTKSSGASEGDRRPLGYWGAFNTWWRNKLSEQGCRPTQAELAQWFTDNANICWPNGDMPTLKEVRTHAKCLRSTEQVRNYFRKYRAARRANSSSMRTSGSDSDSDDGAYCAPAIQSGLVVCGSQPSSASKPSRSMGAIEAQRAMLPFIFTAGGAGAGLFLAGAGGALAGSAVLPAGMTMPCNFLAPPSEPASSVVTSQAPSSSTMGGAAGKRTPYAKYTARALATSSLGLPPRQPTTAPMRPAAPLPPVAAAVSGPVISFSHAGQPQHSANGPSATCSIGGGIVLQLPPLQRTGSASARLQSTPSKHSSPVPPQPPSKRPTLRATYSGPSGTSTICNEPAGREHASHDAMSMPPPLPQSMLGLLGAPDALNVGNAAPGAAMQLHLPGGMYGAASVAPEALNAANAAAAAAASQLLLQQRAGELDTDLCSGLALDVPALPDSVAAAAEGDAAAVSPTLAFFREWQDADMDDLLDDLAPVSPMLQAAPAGGGAPPAARDARHSGVGESAAPCADPAPSQPAHVSGPRPSAGVPAAPAAPEPGQRPCVGAAGPQYPGAYPPPEAGYSWWPAPGPMDMGAPPAHTDARLSSSAGQDANTRPQGQGNAAPATLPANAANPEAPFPMYLPPYPPHPYPPPHAAEAMGLDGAGAPPPGSAPYPPYPYGAPYPPYGYPPYGMPPYYPYPHPHMQPPPCGNYDMYGWPYPPPPAGPHGLPYGSHPGMPYGYMGYPPMGPPEAPLEPGEGSSLRVRTAPGAGGRLSGGSGPVGACAPAEPLMPGRYVWQSTSAPGSKQRGGAKDDVASRLGGDGPARSRAGGCSQGRPCPSQSVALAVVRADEAGTEAEFDECADSGAVSAPAAAAVAALMPPPPARPPRASDAAPQCTDGQAPTAAPADGPAPAEPAPAVVHAPAADATEGTYAHANAAPAPPPPEAGTHAPEPEAQQEAPAHEEQEPEEDHDAAHPPRHHDAACPPVHDPDADSDLLDLSIITAGLFTPTAAALQGSRGAALRDATPSAPVAAANAASCFAFTPAQGTGTARANTFARPPHFAKPAALDAAGTPAAATPFGADGALAHLRPLSTRGAQCLQQQCPPSARAQTPGSAFGLGNSPLGSSLLASWLTSPNSMAAFDACARLGLDLPGGEEEQSPCTGPSPEVGPHATPDGAVAATPTETFLASSGPAARLRADMGATPPVAGADGQHSSADLMASIRITYAPAQAAQNGGQLAACERGKLPASWGVKGGEVLGAWHRDLPLGADVVTKGAAVQHADGFHALI